MEYVLGQTQRRTTEVQTGGACIYGASLFVRHFSLSMAYAGKDKTANCHSFDTTRTLTEQKSGSKVILPENLESSNECLELLVQPANYLPRKLRIGYLLHRWGSCTPWLQTKSPFLPLLIPSSRIVASCPTYSEKRQPCIKKKKKGETMAQLESPYSL